MPRAEQRENASEQPRRARTSVVVGEGEQPNHTSEPSSTRADGARRRGQRKAPPYARKISKYRQFAVSAFAAIMLLGGVIGLAFFARPTASALENRNLTPFPEISAGALFDGSFFTDLSLWFADTYPLREPLVKMNLTMGNLRGVQPSEALIGGNRKSDELPPAGERTDAATPRAERPRNVDEPEVRIRAAEIEDQITDGVYVTDEACYTLYYFDQDATQEYVDVINDAADLLEGQATVYSVLLPTNAGVMLDDSVLAKLGVPNQEQAIDYFYSLMDDNVVPVETFDALNSHRDEYLYFRTDHHWTQLGAYYVYESFCATKGIKPAPYDQWEEWVFEPFYGEYDTVTDVGRFEADKVIARIPQGTNEMEYWVDDLDDSSMMDGAVISDYRDADESVNRYNCFVCGNRPLSVIHNPQVTDGSSCLIIKDSFGNPFVSVMVDSYETIYTMDFRFTSQHLIDFVKEHGIQDVIFENVIMFAGTYDASDMLASIVYPPEGSEEAQAGEAADE